MSLHETTTWVVECDQPGCGRSTPDGERSGWRLQLCAADEWTDCGGFVEADGTAWCENHIPAEVCRGSEDQRDRWELTRNAPTCSARWR